MQRLRDQMDLPLTSAPRDAEHPIRDGVLFRVCRGPSCDKDGGAMPLYEALREALAPHGLGEKVGLAWQSCFGRCRQGPNVAVERWRSGTLSSDAQLSAQLGVAHKDLTLVSKVTVEDVPKLVQRFLG